METPVLTAEERHRLMTVLRELDTHAPTENRRHPRREVQLNLHLHLLGNAPPGIMPATLVNVAARGIGLVTPLPLALKQRFTVHLRFTEGGGWLVLCEVRNCSVTEGGYRVGAEFVARMDDPKGSAQPPEMWLTPGWPREA